MVRCGSLTTVSIGANGSVVKNNRIFRQIGLLHATRHGVQERMVARSMDTG